VRAIHFPSHRICGKFLFVLAASVLPVASTSQADDKELQRELEALKGTWIAVSLTVQSGKIIPKEELDREQVSWTLKGEGKGVFSAAGTDVDYTYSIDPSKSPKTIDLTIVGPAEELKGHKQFGIYKLEKGKLTLCLTGPDGTKEDRPKEFTVKDQTGVLVEMERPAKK
jgi:uncharacterized protein (TIGR03067 family)